jgi:putative lipoprotein
VKHQHRRRLASPRALIAALWLPLLAACDGGAPTPSGPASPDPAPSESTPPENVVTEAVPAAEEPAGAIRQLNWAWDCDDGRYLVSSERDGVFSLFLGGPDRRTLERVPAASGAKYEGDGVLFWSRGEEARFELDGVATTCRVNAYRSIWEDAKLRGADFRAVGNEPGWHLELFSSEESLLVTDYGNRRLRFMAAGPEPLTDSTGSVFSGEADGIRIRIELTPGPCADTMADIEYETTVVVELDDRRLQGCGNALH